MSEKPICKTGLFEWTRSARHFAFFVRGQQEPCKKRISREVHRRDMACHVPTMRCAQVRNESRRFARCVARMKPLADAQNGTAANATSSDFPDSEKKRFIYPGEPWLKLQTCFARRKRCTYVFVLAPMCVFEARASLRSVFVECRVSTRLESVCHPVERRYFMSSLFSAPSTSMAPQPLSARQTIGPGEAGAHAALSACATRSDDRRRLVFGALLFVGRLARRSRTRTAARGRGVGRVACRGF